MSVAEKVDWVLATGERGRDFMLIVIVVVGGGVMTMVVVLRLSVGSLGAVLSTSDCSTTTVFV